MYVASIDLLEKCCAAGILWQAQTNCDMDLLRGVALVLFNFASNATWNAAETQNFSLLHVPTLKLNTKM